jgi:arylsulfatase A-like enzyme
MRGAETKQPNIVLFLADDQGAWALGCAGNAEVRTPNLDRIAATGMMFENFFCSSPVCSPARATILTGRIPSQHGVHDWIRAGNTTGERDGYGGLIEYLAGQTGYSDLLAQAGYICGLSGKWHVGDSLHPQKGFVFWEAHAGGGGPYYNAPMVHDGAVYSEPRYVSDAITDNALRFLEQRRGAAEPFCLSVNYTAPHSPWEREHHPVEIYDDYFRNCPFNSTPRLPMHPWQVNSAPCGFTEDSRRAILSGYYAAISAMDAGIGRILDWLEREGMRGDTLVVFMSDNGMNMGHHGLFGKGNATFPMNMFDTSVKVPMLVSQPGRVPAGLRNADLLSQYDFMPTVLEWAGVANPAAAGLPGRSFAPILRGESVGARPVVVFDEYGPVRMIRDGGWKYVHRYPYGPHELYDLASDPDEAVNLVQRPECRDRVRSMRDELERWFERYVDPARDGAREGVTGKGQLCLCGPAARGRAAYSEDWRYESGHKFRPYP